MPRNERDWLKVQVDDLLERKAQATHGRLWYVKLGASRWQRVGLPDYVLCIGGMFGALEIKHPTDMSQNISPIQRYILSQIGRAGGAFCVARNVDFVERWVDGLLAGNRLQRQEP